MARVKNAPKLEIPNLQQLLSSMVVGDCFCIQSKNRESVNAEIIKHQAIEKAFLIKKLNDIGSLVFRMPDFTNEDDKRRMVYQNVNKSEGTRTSFQKVFGCNRYDVDSVLCEVGLDSFTTFNYYDNVQEELFISEVDRLGNVKNFHKEYSPVLYSFYSHLSGYSTKSNERIDKETFLNALKSSKNITETCQALGISITLYKKYIVLYEATNHTFEAVSKQELLDSIKNYKTPNERCQSLGINVSTYYGLLKKHEISTKTTITEKSTNKAFAEKCLRAYKKYFGDAESVMKELNINKFSFNIMESSIDGLGWYIERHKLLNLIKETDYNVHTLGEKLNMPYKQLKSYCFQYRLPVSNFEKKDFTEPIKFTIPRDSLIKQINDAERIPVLLSELNITRYFFEKYIAFYDVKVEELNKQLIKTKLNPKPKQINNNNNEKSK